MRDRTGDSSDNAGYRNPDCSDIIKIEDSDHWYPEPDLSHGNSPYQADGALDSDAISPRMGSKFDSKVFEEDNRNYFSGGRETKEDTLKSTMSQFQRPDLSNENFNPLELVKHDEMRQFGTQPHGKFLFKNEL